MSKTSDYEEGFKPYLSRAKINGREIVTLRDTGNNYDLCGEEHIKKEQLTGDYIFVKQPLDSKIRCLPVAHIEIDFDGLGSLKTEVGVVDKEADLHYYLLGNKTQKIIELTRKKVDYKQTRT